MRELITRTESEKFQMTAFPTVEADPGVMRRVLSDHPELMMVSFVFEEGAIGKLHSHPHIQSTYVSSGRFRFSLDGVESEYAAGDSLVIPSNAIHGCECLEAGELIDCFTPRRDDFL